MPGTDMLLQQLGPRLREARQAANLTVRDAGERLGLDHSMIVRYENGDLLPPLDRLIALADLYGLTPRGAARPAGGRCPADRGNRPGRGRDDQATCGAVGCTR